ncbi:MAG: Gfo/Idh/MocA family oxidoreductase [Bacteroidota bacterium]|jgi:predicted dehydrogenase
MNTIKNIAIIGAGQLGSRHLQALANVKFIDIQVFDTSETALETAKSRFAEVNSSFSGNITFHTSVSELKKEIELIIIATGSKFRNKIIENIVEASDVKYFILEKFLFTKASHYKTITDIFKTKNCTAWVNCPRRLIDYYQLIKKELSGNIHFSVTGNSWGLGCNGIHFLDFFSYLTNTAQIRLNNSLLDKQIIESKRQGYDEFTGTITGSANGSSFTITSYKENISPLLITIQNNDFRYIILEGNTSKVIKSSREKNWATEEISFTIPFQSQLTNLVVDDILNTGKCNLTTFEESSELHLNYLELLIDFTRKIKNDFTIDECLIT